MTAAGAMTAAAGAAVAIGVATALQHAEARRAEPRTAGDVRLVLSLARRRRWLLAGAVEVVGLSLQALALRLGPVTLVQAVVVAGLPVAVVASVPLGAAAIRRRTLAAVAVCTAALAVLGGVLPTDVPAVTGVGRASLIAGVTMSVAVVGLLAAHRAGSSWALGAAAGVAVGAGAVLLAMTVRQVQHPLTLLASWPPYALAAVGAAGLVLSQSALQAPAIAAPLTALTVTEPAVAAVLGVAVLHERLPAGTPSRVVAVLAGAVVVAAVAVLARDADR